MTSDIRTLLHRLWTKAVGTPDYDKKEWKAMEAAIEAEVVRYQDAISCGKGGLRLSPPCGKCMACEIASLKVAVSHRPTALQLNDMEDQRNAALAALEGVYQAVGHDGKCWCAYERLVHPKDDPQDALRLEPNGHTKGCNVARAVMGEKP